MTTIELRRGDSATLAFSTLATASRSTLPNFASTDVLKFTVRVTWASPVVLALESPGSIAWTPNSATGAVTIAPTDWEHGEGERSRLEAELGIEDSTVHETRFTHPRSCVWDLQRTTASGAVTTVAAGSLTVLPDVTE